MRTQLAVVFVVLALILVGTNGVTAHYAAAPMAAPQTAIGTAFTYQGQLTSLGTPVTGNCDMIFRLYDAAQTGNQVGDSINTTVPINNGLFTASLDFGAGSFDGTARWLDLQVKCGSESAYTAITPRYAITPVPYAGCANNVAPQPVPGKTTQQIAMLKWYTAITGDQSKFGVDANPAGIAFDGENMWVVNLLSDSVSVIRGSDGTHVMTPTVGYAPDNIAFDGANMWVTNTGGDTGNTISVLRARDGFNVMTLTVGTRPDGIAFDGTNMWIANYRNNSVSVLRASDGALVRTVPVSGGPFGMAFDGKNMWVTLYDYGTTVIVLRASDGQQIMTLTAGHGPQGLAFDGTNMWVTNDFSNNVSVFRANDGSLVRTISVGTRPYGIAFDGANMWVVNYSDNNVSVLRASDGAFVKTVPVGIQPSHIAFDGAYMWVTNQYDNTVSKR